MNRADRRDAAKRQRACKDHDWVSKPAYPWLGTWCYLCGLQQKDGTS